MRKEEAFLLEEELAPDSKWEMTQNGKSETHVWRCRSFNQLLKKARPVRAKITPSPGQNSVLLF
jgi:hypothetical protein